MGKEAEVLRDPEFRKLLAQRSRWRWGLSGISLIALRASILPRSLVGHFSVRQSPGASRWGT
jgi:hypothetical protein